MTFRWCCVRVKASEIAFVGFDHSPCGQEQLTPTALGYLQQHHDYVWRLGFCRKIRFPEKKKAHQFPGALFAFPLRCGHFCTVLLLRTASSNSQSPIRSNCSHCRKSPLKPMLPATWKVEMTHLSMGSPLFSARSQTNRNSRRDR